MPMGERLNIMTAGTHCIGAYLSKPAGKPKGGVVVVQEIFGVTPHIRAVADRFAEAGYTAVAPAFFDYVENDVELGYDKAGMERGKEDRKSTRLNSSHPSISYAVFCLKKKKKNNKKTR